MGARKSQQDSRDFRVPCVKCGIAKPPGGFGVTRGRQRRTCKTCRSAYERLRHAAGPRPLRFCSVCGTQLAGHSKLDVCRSNPDCLRISVRQHNFPKSRRRQDFTPCAGCGGDWTRASNSQKLCPRCRETGFWCYGVRRGGGHVAELAMQVPPGTRCRFCRLLIPAYVRSKKRGLPYALTWNYVQSIWTGTCPYLGIPLKHGTLKLTKHSPTLDRINPALGYVEGNIEVVSYLANAMKRDATPEQLARFAREVLRRAT